MSDTYTTIRLKNTSSIDDLDNDLVNAGFRQWDGEEGETVDVDCETYLMPVCYDPEPEFDEDGMLIEDGVDQGPHGDLRCRADDSRLDNLDYNKKMANGTKVLAEPETAWHYWAE